MRADAASYFACFYRYSLLCLGEFRGWGCACVPQVRVILFYLGNKKGCIGRLGKTDVTKK